MTTRSWKARKARPRKQLKERGPESNPKMTRFSPRSRGNTNRVQESVRLRLEKKGKERCGRESVARSDASKDEC